MMTTINSISAILLLITMSFNLHSQNLSIGAKWYYGYSRETPCQYEYMLYEIVGDTIIDGKTSYFLESSFHDRYGSEIMNPLKEILYESEHKLYIYKNNGFHVIFDYTAQKGDTITVMDEAFDGFFGLSDEFAPYHLFQYVVNSIDTLEISDMQFKRFLISGTDSADWTYAPGTEILEDIGRYNGDYFGNIFGFPKKLNSVLYGFCSLRCFNDISFTEYSCDHFGAISSVETNQQVTDILFYPSVIKDKIVFMNYVECVKIYNLLGQKKVELNSVSKGEYNLNQLHHGIYLIEIENNNEKRIFKIIKN